MKPHIFRNRAYFALLVVMLLPLGASAQRRGAANAKPSGTTPRTADGKPDFSGIWGPLALDNIVLATREDSIVGENTAQALEGGSGGPEAFGWWITVLEKDAQISSRDQRNRPLYKPEYWDKVRATDWDFSRKKDRGHQCMPSVPRLGAPEKIIQTPKEIVFLYENHFRYRIIPTDNRPHHPIKSEMPTWFGDSTGHWEGDTLVIETIALTDQSWLGGNGYFHSESTKVTERFKRDGNTLTIETTVEDPMLMQPWQMGTETVKLNTNPKAIFQENFCVDNDSHLLNDPKNLDPTRQGH